MSSSLSSNDNSAASDSITRASYYASTQHHHLHQQQHHHPHHHTHQQPYLNSNPNHIHHPQLSYSNRSYPNAGASSQHQSLSQIFPSIYNDPSTSSSYMSGNPSGSISAASGHVTSVQRQIQQDWSNREYIEVILSNIKKITDFLNTFDLSCRSKLAILDEKLTKLEREIDFVEARVTKGETLN